MLGSALKVCVVGGGWVVGVESKFSDRLWLRPSRTILEHKDFIFSLRNIKIQHEFERRKQKSLHNRAVQTQVVMITTN